MHTWRCFLAYGASIVDVLLDSARYPTNGCKLTKQTPNCKSKPFYMGWPLPQHATLRVRATYGVWSPCTIDDRIGFTTDIRPETRQPKSKVCISWFRYNSKHGWRQARRAGETGCCCCPELWARVYSSDNTCKDGSGRISRLGSV